MKKLGLLVIIGLMTSIGVQAQKSAVKLGLGGLFVTAPNLRFEQAIGDRMSFQITGSYKFPTNFNNSTLNGGFQDGALSGFAVIPELRFYFGQANAGTIKGFYVAPYLKYHKYEIKATQTIDYVDATGVSNTYTPKVNLNLRTIGAGVQLGYHWVIGEHFSLDWHFLGLGGDAHRLGLKYNFKDSNADLKDLARQLIDDFNENYEGDEDLPFSLEDLFDSLDPLVEGNKARVGGAFPFIGFRAGLSLGYAF